MVHVKVYDEGIRSGMPTRRERGESRLCLYYYFRGTYSGPGSSKSSKEMKKLAQEGERKKGRKKEKGKSLCKAARREKQRAHPRVGSKAQAARDVIPLVVHHRPPVEKGRSNNDQPMRASSSFRCKSWWHLFLSRRSIASKGSRCMRVVFLEYETYHSTLLE